MNNSKKMLIILIVGFLFMGLVAAQTDYNKCIKNGKYVDKKIQQSLIKRILLSIIPFGWINWITGYATYKEEIDCAINETGKLIELKDNDNFWGNT